MPPNDDAATADVSKDQDNGTGTEEDKSMADAAAADDDKSKADADASSKASKDDAAGADGSGDEFDWREAMASGIDEDARKAFRTSLDKHSSLGDFAKAIRAERKGREGMISIPGENATDEEKAAFNKALGVPETPADYKYDTPDWIAEMVGADEAAAQEKAALEGMHGLGYTPDQAAGGLDLYYKLLEGSEASKREFASKAATESETILKRDFGADYDQNMELAHRLMEGQGTADLLELRLEDGRKIGDLVGIVKPLVNLARITTGEGDLHLGTFSESARQSVDDEINSITAQAHKEGNYWSDQVQSKLRRLYEKRDGTASADGRM